jgi:hypothetical protein
VAAILALLAVTGGNDGPKEEPEAEAIAAVATGEETEVKPSTDTLVKNPEETEVKPGTDTIVKNPERGVNIDASGEEESTRRFVELRINSEPSAALYPVGSDTPVCKSTPCDLRIDSADGGSPDRRDYVLRAANYTDKSVTVNLRDPRDKIFVGLEEIVVETDPGNTQTPTNVRKNNRNRNNRNRNDRNRNDRNRKPKCKAGAQDTFNPFGAKEPCRR